jgi:hypothetical protein
MTPRQMEKKMTAYTFDELTEAADIRTALCKEADHLAGNGEPIKGRELKRIALDLRVESLLRLGDIIRKATA